MEISGKISEAKPRNLWKNLDTRKYQVKAIHN